MVKFYFASNFFAQSERTEEWSSVVGVPKCEGNKIETGHRRQWPELDEVYFQAELVWDRFQSLVIFRHKSRFEPLIKEKVPQFIFDKTMHNAEMLSDCVLLIKSEVHLHDHGLYWTIVSILDFKFPNNSF